MDVMAIHPYTFAQQSRPEWTFDLFSLTYPNLNDSIDLARHLLDKIGCPEKPLYLTEIGWPDLLIGKERQGAYLVRSILQASQKGVEYYFWYTFWDGDGGATIPTEDAFGLFTWPGDDPEAKENYIALSALHETIGALKPAGDLGQALDFKEDHHAALFGNGDNSWAVALWHSLFDIHEEITVKIPFPPTVRGDWRLYNQMGEEIATGQVSDSNLEITITGKVKYLVFETAD